MTPLCLSEGTMSNRLEKLVAIAVKPVPKPVESDNILLKVCPRCKAPHSRYDSHCQRCTKKAKRTERILKANDIKDRLDAGERVSKEEQEFLSKNEALLSREVGPEDMALLEQAPFELPEETIAVRPTFRNRLQFFMDRMQEQGRKVTTTFAATKLLKLDNKEDFVNFATDHGVRSLMTADWQELYAAWRVEDVLKLFHERQTEKATRTVVETESGKMLTSQEAANMLGMPGTKMLVDLATEFGVKPARAFGDRPEQMAWHAADIEALRRVNELDAEAARMEEAVQRLEHDITALQAKPMKWPDMQAFRKKTEDLNIIRNELAKVEQYLEREGLKLQELAAKREQAQAPAKEASDNRLVRILAIAAGPTAANRRTLVDKAYDIVGKAVKMLTNEKDLMDLLTDEQREMAMDGVQSFDGILGYMLDALNVTPHEGAKLPLDELKRLNTAPTAKNCASCGGPLKNPMPSLPSMKYCPNCEP